jgi:hypothetical protein
MYIFASIRVGVAIGIGIELSIGNRRMRFEATLTKADTDSDSDPDPDGALFHRVVRGRPKPGFLAVVDYSRAEGSAQHSFSRTLSGGTESAYASGEAEP